MRRFNSFVLFCLFFWSLTSSCEKSSEEYIKENKNGLLWVRSNNASVEADGKSSLILFASITPNADLKLVNFKTSSGFFSNIDSNSGVVDIEAQMKGDSLIARATLTSSQEINEDVNIKVSIAGIDTTLFARFTRAYPDSLNLESAISSIKRGYNNEVPLQATLIRKIGIPSLHQFSTFSAIKDNEEHIGEFRSISSSGSDALGNISSIFVLKDTTFTGRIRLISAVQGKNSAISDTFSVFVTQ